MAACSAFRCTNRPSKKLPNISFHKFPINPDRRAAWTKAVQRKDWVPSKIARLCSEHFTEDMFDRSSTLKIQLQPGAIPTLFKTLPSDLQQHMTPLAAMEENKVMKSEITSECLPQEFENCIVEIKDNLILIRSSIKSMSDINTWVNSFGRLTNTQWNCRDSNPSGQAFVCRKKFICHHSSFKKVSSEENKKGLSKNSGCEAYIKIKVKLNSQRTRKTDKYIRQGLVGVIHITPHHTHTLNTAETLRFLPPSDCKEAFMEYFNDGMGITESSRHHEKILEMSENFQESDLANSRINPTVRSIRNWYDQWRFENFGPGTGPDMIDIQMCQELYETIRNCKTQEGRLVCEMFIRAPNHSSLAGIVTSPIDMLKIEQKLKTGEYVDLQEFTSDVELMVNTAKSYYEETSQEYQDACELWKVFSDTKIFKEEKSKENGDVIELKKVRGFPKRIRGYHASLRKRRESNRLKRLQETAKERKIRLDHARAVAAKPIVSRPVLFPAEVQMCEELYEIVRNHKTQTGRLLCQSFIRSPNRLSLPEYYEIVTSPIDLLKVKQKLKTEQYTEMQQFTSDIELIVSNAKSYYKETSQEYQDACELWKLFSEAKRGKVEGHSGGNDEKGSEVQHGTSKLLPGANICRKRVRPTEFEAAVKKMSFPTENIENLYNTVKNFKRLNRIQLSEPFQELPDRRCEPDYFKKIKNPISLNEIEKKIKKRKYTIVAEVVDDMNVMFENAKKYNSPTSEVFNDAVKLQKIMQTEAKKLMDSYIKNFKGKVTGYNLFASELRKPVKAANLDDRLGIKSNHFIKKKWRQMPKKNKTFYEECAEKQNEAQAKLLNKHMHQSPGGFIHRPTSEKYDLYAILLPNFNQPPPHHTLIKSQIPQIDSIKQEFILSDDRPNRPFTNSSSEIARIEMQFCVDQDENTTEPGSVPSDRYATMDATESIVSTPDAHGQTYSRWPSGQLSLSANCGLLIDAFPVDLNSIKKEPIDLDLVKKEVNDETLCY